jgi:hypothetical protein
VTDAAIPETITDDALVVAEAYLLHRQRLPDCLGSLRTRTTSSIFVHGFISFGDVGDHSPRDLSLTTQAVVHAGQKSSEAHLLLGSIKREEE